MNKLRAVIIDDERPNRELIGRLITRLNTDFEICAEADDVKSGFEIINRNKPDVVFLDIRMPGGTGFDMLQMFKAIDFEVVFITGFDNYALKAFEFNAIDYVLKPIDSDLFTKTLERVQNRIRKKEVNGENLKSFISSLDANKPMLSKIPVHYGSKVVLLDVENLVYAQAAEGCTVFCISTGEKYTSSKQLSDFTFILEGYPFMFRANRGIFINMRCIVSYSKGSSCILTMKDNSLVEVSRRKKSDILKLLSNKF